MPLKNRLWFHWIMLLSHPAIQRAHTSGRTAWVDCHMDMRKNKREKLETAWTDNWAVRSALFRTLVQLWIRIDWIWSAWKSQNSSSLVMFISEIFICIIIVWINKRNYRSLCIRYNLYYDIAQLHRNTNNQKFECLIHFILFYVC